MKKILAIPFGLIYFPALGVLNITSNIVNYEAKGKGEEGNDKVSILFIMPLLLWFVIPFHLIALTIYFSMEWWYEELLK